LPDFARRPLEVADSIRGTSMRDEAMFAARMVTKVPEGRKERGQNGQSCSRLEMRLSSLGIGHLEISACVHSRNFIFHSRVCLKLFARSFRGSNQFHSLILGTIKLRHKRERARLCSVRRTETSREKGLRRLWKLLAFAARENRNKFHSLRTTERD